MILGGESLGVVALADLGVQQVAATVYNDFYGGNILPKRKKKPRELTWAEALEREKEHFNVVEDDRIDDQTLVPQWHMEQEEDDDEEERKRRRYLTMMYLLLN